MKSSLVRTAIVTSLITAVVVSALTLYAFPRLMNNNANDPQATMQPAVNSTAAQDDGGVGTRLARWIIWREAWD